VLASVRRLLRVDALHVRVEVTLLRERLTTRGALVRLHLRVRGQVPRDVALVLGAVVAKEAAELLLVAPVHVLALVVPLQALAVGEELATVAARVKVF